jgi:hypothetical protein
MVDSRCYAAARSTTGFHSLPQMQIDLVLFDLAGDAGVAALRRLGGNVQSEFWSLSSVRKRDPFLPAPSADRGLRYQ